MLELDRDYSIKEIENLKDFVTVTYVIIDDIYHKVTPTRIANRCNINDSIMSDSEIITISIVGELLTIDSEKAWFGFCKKNMRGLFPRFCDRTRFNRTRRNLHAVIEEIRKELSKLTGYAKQPYRIVDSIPIPVCKFGRATFHKTFKGYGAAYGNCSSKKETYLGYKLHMRTILDGFVTDFVITPANIDDREGVWDLKKNFDRLKDKRVVVFSVGASPAHPGAINDIKNNNFTEEMKEKVSFFHLRGGFNYKKLNPIDRVLTHMLKKKIERKKPDELTDDEKGMLACYKHPADWTNKKSINPIIECIKREIQD